MDKMSNIKDGKEQDILYYCLFGYDTVQCGTYLPACRRKVLRPSDDGWSCETFQQAASLHGVVTLNTRV